jgi:hypothetical protein
MSPAGRGAAATIAAYFVEQEAGEDLAGRLDPVLARLDTIGASLQSHHAGSTRVGVDRPDDGSLGFVGAEHAGTD